MIGYRLALPTPWERIPVGDGMKEKVAEIAGRAVTRVTDRSPDELAKIRITLEQQLLRQLAAAEKAGAVDFYLPTDLLHGMAVSASFSVHVVMPDAMAPEGLAAKAMASMIAEDERSTPVSIAGRPWVRTDKVVGVPTEEDVALADSQEVAKAVAAVRGLVGEGDGEDRPLTGSRSVEYMAPVPSDERYWLLVEFTTFGDGDPAGELADVLVELFDAIMSTWRWESEPA